jgi:hypothetical protein
MNNSFQELLQQLAAVWKEIGVNQRISIVLAGLVVLLGLTGVAVWSSREDYAILFGNLGEAEAAKVGRGVVVVDYVQNLPGFGPFLEDKTRIAESMRWLQRIGREAGWLCIVVSQVDKKTVKENKRPGMADGLGAGEIEHASGMILSVWRPHQGEPKALSDNEHIWHLRQRMTEVTVLKNKYGERGTSVVAFDAARMVFRTPTPNEQEAWA